MPPKTKTVEERYQKKTQRERNKRKKLRRIQFDKDSILREVWLPVVQEEIEIELDEAQGTPLFPRRSSSETTIQTGSNRPRRPDRPAQRT